MGSPQPNILATPRRSEFSLAFWGLVVLTGVGSGLAAGLLMKLLYFVQHMTYGYEEGSFLQGVEKVGASTRILAPLAAGMLAATVLYIMSRWPSPHSGELEATIWYRSGHFDPPRTLARAILSIVIVGLGASLGREQAPKQLGSLIGSVASSWRGLPPCRQRLLVACGAGAGMAAVYNVPLGGALFALEVLLGTLALPLIAPAIATSLLAVASAWLLLPNEATYHVPEMHVTASLVVWAIVFGPIAGVASAWFVKLISWVARLRPKGAFVFPAAFAVFLALGLLAIPYPQLLGNGKNAVQLAALDKITLPTLFALVVLKPLVTVSNLGSGAPGGLFTPTLAFGALLGGVAGHAWMIAWPEPQGGAFAIVGAAAVLAATTKGPISALVLMLELAHHIEGLMVPILIAVALATTVAQRIDVRSTYTSRVRDLGPLSERVIAAGLAAPGTPITAVSSAMRYDELLRLCIANERPETIFVVDDDGHVLGAIASADVLSPPPSCTPLEIAAADDFATPYRPSPREPGVLAGSLCLPDIS